MVQGDLLDWAPRHEAAERATAHADSQSPGWGGHAYDALVSFLEGLAVGETFIAERWVREAMSHGLGEPPTRRAFGAVTSRARRAGLIEPAGFGMDQYASPKTRWRRR